MRKYRGFLTYAIVVLLVFGLLYYLLVGGVKTTSLITYATFENELEEGNVLSVEIKQNSSAPTGVIFVTLKSDSDDADTVYKVIVPDVTAVQEKLVSEDFENYEVHFRTLDAQEDKNIYPQEIYTHARQAPVVTSTLRGD